MYPDGSLGVQNHIKKFFKYPKEAAERNIMGRVLIKFVIEKDGTLSTFENTNDSNPLLVNAVITIFKKMELWEPGYIKGKPIRSSYTIPVNFKLQ